MTRLIEATTTTQEFVSYGHRMKIEQEKDAREVFIAEYDAKNSELNVHWQTGNNLDLIKDAVEEVYEKKVMWNEQERILWGSIEDGGIWVMSSSQYTVARAGMHFKITEGAVAQNALERIAKLALKTTARDVTLPENLSDQLKQFAKSALPTKPTR